MHKHNYNTGISHHNEKPTLSRSDERRRLAWALAVTAVILIAEVVGGILSGSLALISDAGHMFVDALSLFMSYIALAVSQRRPDERFTFGLQRVEILAALINGVTLLVVCAYIVYEGVQRFITPVEIDIPLMLVVATIGIAANIVSAVLLQHAHTLNVRSAFLHVLGDLFSSVGILVAGIIMLFWDVPWLDPALSIVIAAVILISAYRLTSEALKVLLEAAPQDIPVQEIRDFLLAFDYVEDIHALHVWTITTGRTAMNCHVVLRHNNEDRADELLAELSREVRERFGIGHLTIQIESAAYDRQKQPCRDEIEGEEK